MKKELVVIVTCVSIMAGFTARTSRPKQSNIQSTPRHYELTIDNTESKKTSIVALGYRDTARAGGKIVKAEQIATVSGNERLESIGVRQGRFVIKKEGNFTGKITLKIMPDPSSYKGFDFKVIEN